jgi:hypothetical protein
MGVKSFEPGNRGGCGPLVFVAFIAGAVQAIFLGAFDLNDPGVVDDDLDDAKAQGINLCLDQLHPSVIGFCRLIKIAHKLITSGIILENISKSTKILKIMAKSTQALGNQGNLNADFWLGRLILPNSIGLA